MGKNSHKFQRGGRSRRGHDSRSYRGKNFPQSKHQDGWKNRNAPSNTPTEKREFVQTASLKEHQVGITEFVSTGKGFTGVVKARFSDFHVNEIDLDGVVLELNDFKIPKPKEPEICITPEELESAKKDLANVVSDEKWETIAKIAKNECEEPLEIDVTDLDKEKRTIIHRLIKKLYETKCNSATVARDDKKFIRVDKKKYRGSQWTFPGEYVHFLVYKENMDTSEVASKLANNLRLRPSQVNYCGTKDKRGRTTQKFCIKRRNPSQIVHALPRFSSVKIGNFTFHENVLKLGHLKGNRFRIVLRHVDGDLDEIEKSLQSVKEHGFINYYGLQRFGNNASVPTYQVGIALLKSDYKMACELILKPRDNDIPFMRNIRETWWKNRDSAAAASMFKFDKFIEKKLLDGLSQFGENDYANSLRKIPRNTLLLYTHAYQSWIFNRVASKRIKEHGLKLIVGDLVYRNQDELDEAAVDAENMTSNIGEDVDGNGEDSIAEETETNFKQKVKALTEEDISSGNYTVLDVVLPLPGHDITYPANETAQWYEKMLAEESLSSEKLKHGVKTYSLAGAYRKLFVQPQNMSWYFKKYNSPEEDVIQSHFENGNAGKNDDLDNEGKFTALVLDFCLPASAYATMLLREILKSDTSASSQAQIARDEMKKFEGKISTEFENKITEDKNDLNSTQDTKTTEKRPLEEAVSIEEFDVKRIKQDVE